MSYRRRGVQRSYAPRNYASAPSQHSASASSQPEAPRLFSFSGLTYVVAGADRLGVVGQVAGVSSQLAQLFAVEGANVLACGPNPQGFQLVQLCNDLKATYRLPGRCIFLQGDCSKKRFCQRVAKTAIQSFGAIHGLAALGVYVPREDGGMSDVSWKDCMATIRTNGGIVHNMIQAVVPYMRTQGVGRIVLANSRSATGYPGQRRYAYSKGLTTTVKYLMLEFASDNVLCNTLCLGTTPNGGEKWDERNRLHPRGRRGLAMIRPSEELITDAQAAWHFAVLLHPNCRFCAQEPVLDGGEQAAGTILRTSNFLSEAESLCEALESARDNGASRNGRPKARKAHDDPEAMRITDAT